MIKKYGIRTHVTLLTLVPLLLMTVSLGFFFLHARFADLNHDLIMKGQLVGRQLAGSSEYGIFSSNRWFMKGMADNALQQPDVRSVIVLNASLKILAASGKMPSALDTKSSDIAFLNADKLLGLVNSSCAMFDNGKTVLLYQPILQTQIELDDAQSNTSMQQMGAVIIEMDWAATRKIKSRLLWITLMSTTAFLLVTLYLVHLASRRIINPIKSLSVAVHALGSGDLNTRLILPSCITELCTLNEGINQMAADLQHERAILQQRIAEATEQLRNLAFYDPLTLLPNRRLLSDRLTQALATSARSGRYGALMFLDLDNFKPINDQYGHAVGDLLLIEAARRIGSCLREIDTVARFGGDEFVVMLCELNTERADSQTQAHVVAEKIRTVLSAPYSLAFQNEDQTEGIIEHHCTSSIGVVLYLNHEASQDDILYWADAMMYQAKKDGRNRIRFYS